MELFDRVYIEISNICNLQCDFCPPVERHKQVMSATQFARVLPQLKGMTREVCLHLMGEPLGHPEFAQILKVATDVGIPIQLTTNGILLNPSLQALCLSPIIRQVNLSIHSFEANFGLRDVSGYMRKVFAFTHEAFIQRPDLYINYRVWDLQSVHGSDKNAAIRQAIEDEFAFSVQDLKIDVRRKKGYRIVNRLYLHFDSRFVWPSLKQEIRSAQGFCNALVQHFGIHADGTVVPCCLDKEATIPLGNCFDDSLAEILQRPRAREMRDGFARGQLVEGLCQRCDFASRFDRKARGLLKNTNQAAVRI